MKDIGDMFSYINERGILSGLYIGTIVFGMVLGTNQTQPIVDIYPWIFLICAILGLIIGNVTYEILLPVLRFVTDFIVIRGFNNTVGQNAKQKFRTYGDIRKFREKFLSSDNPERLKENIVKDEKLRLMLAYLVTSSIASYVMILVAEQLVKVDNVILLTEESVVFYIFLATFLGRFIRAYSLGRNIGIAYLYQTQK